MLGLSAFMRAGCGTEADSNRDLIVDKLRFDMSENPSGLNVQLYCAAVEAGFLSFEDVQECLSEMTFFYDIEERPKCNPRIRIEYSETTGQMRVHVFGEGELNWRYVADTEFEIPEAEYKTLLITLGNMSFEEDKARYIQFFVTQKGHPIVTLPEFVK